MAGPDKGGGRFNWGEKYLMSVPAATYRIQLNSQFTFEDASQTVKYLKELGISHIYASPVFMARTGSLHGYDCVDQNVFNPVLGREKKWRALMRRLEENRMGWIQDIVPNHMAYDKNNKMLMDVLELGDKSKFYDFFDVNWDHVYESLKGKILAPFLGKYYGECLEDGEIKLIYEKEGIMVNYFDLKFPLRLESYLYLLEKNFNNLPPEKILLPDELKLFLQPFQKMIKARNRVTPEKYQNESDRFKSGLRSLFARNSSVEDYMIKRIGFFNGYPGDPESFIFLDQLLSQQYFRLSFWKVATEEVNYRRFFNLNELICLKTEHEKVFKCIHKLLFRMMEENAFSGLRIDHVDGLYDPMQYLKRLRKKDRNMYLVVEKILTLDEDLPKEWPVQGTTGYDGLNYINGIFCQQKNHLKFQRIYSRFIKRTISVPELIKDKKRMIIGKHMAGDIDNLAHAVKKISGRYWSGRDITLYGLRRSLVEIMTQFSVYRTYRNSLSYRNRDRDVINEAIDGAVKEIPDLGFELAFIRKLLIHDPDESLEEEDKNCWWDFIMRFQQFTGPLMAKGFEDTALYIYNRLLSLNEVGGDPGKFGHSGEEFHRFNLKRVQQWPLSMTATATHDTKRGEDVRARINVLSEIPDEWYKKVRSWSRMNRKLKTKVGGEKVPDKNDEYALYQILVGSYPFEQVDLPLFKERIKACMIKSVREAKVHTAWIKPDSTYEDALQDFIENILNPVPENTFFQEFLEFQRKIAYFGVFNSLSQIILKLTMPGVPDLYQGTELWDLNLVDPDNRHPVDFKKRQVFLRDLINKQKRDILGIISEILTSPQDGRVKLFLIYRLLQTRRKYHEVFKQGGYLPLEIKGIYNEHILAFMREYGNIKTISVVPRFLTSLVGIRELPLGEDVWKDTAIFVPGDSLNDKWENTITGSQVKDVEKVLSVAEILKHFPVASLICKEDQ